jgi:hypothetical protein
VTAGTEIGGSWRARGLSASWSGALTSGAVARDGGDHRGPGGERRRELTLATYLAALREHLARAGKHLVEAEQLASHFTVVLRHARYMYPTTGKFYLHLLTVLQPVGK